MLQLLSAEKILYSRIAEMSFETRILTRLARGITDTSFRG